MKKSLKYINDLLIELNNQIPNGELKHGIKTKDGRLIAFIVIPKINSWVEWVFDEEQELTPKEYIDLIVKELSKHYEL